jgi:hypothetical protein
MRITDNRETVEVTNDRELEEFLARRFIMDGVHVNSFMMSHMEEGPAMGVLVREDLACLTYLADCRGTAFASQGDLPALVKNGMTEFRLDSQRQPVLNSQIVSFAESVQVAKEFMRAEDLPRSIRWLRL